MITVRKTIKTLPRRLIIADYLSETENGFIVKKPKRCAN